MFVAVICLFFLFLMVFLSIYYGNKGNATQTFQKFQLKKDIPYFRDIPFDNLEEAFFTGALFGIIENASDFIGAVILKWLNEKKIAIVK